MKDGSSDRRQRLAEALRANLKRRKVQQRGREAVKPDEPPPAGRGHTGPSGNEA